MSMKLASLIAAAIFIAVAAGFYFFGDHAGGQPSGLLSATAWQRMASPGALSQAHAFLEHDCAACHTSVKGATATKCIACHANETALLQRQPTSFHGNVGSCQECHLEHQGLHHHPIAMDHSALAEIGFHQLALSNSDDGVNRLVGRQLLDWIAKHKPADNEAGHNISIAPNAAVLDCAHCHATIDPHRELFGNDCAQCHGVTNWMISEFRHPSASSTNCMHCHLAPASHYMMHFKMISAKVARQPSADVTECFKCHQTTSWNDIKGVGWYKHH